ncbi:hypothetical protein E4T39_05024 [Aureobasidium subglaciale]|nr:hypothetical protein E4T39_05024 [Aureobasidium subglaciale]
MSNFSWRPPTVPFEAQTRDGAPFTVWHVCMICQQPRSARYHSEHPNNHDYTYTPSQTICRRCAAKAPPISEIAPEIPVAASAMRHVPFRHIVPLSPPPAPQASRAAERQSTISSYTPVLEIVHASRTPSSRDAWDVPAPSSRHAWENGSSKSAQRAPAPLANVRPSVPRRVSFSREDEVVMLPEELPSGHGSLQGLSRMRIQPPNLTGMRNPANDYEHDKHKSAVYMDPSERSYVSSPKWTPLSESPARELPLADESYAHGPYRAEVSPSPSMRVQVDNYDFVPIDKAGNDKPENIHPYQRPPVAQESESGFSYQAGMSRYEGGQQGKPVKQKEEGLKKDMERAWTRFTTVREYIDSDGPYMEVEEKIVFDD